MSHLPLPVVRDHGTGSRVKQILVALLLVCAPVTPCGATDGMITDGTITIVYEEPLRGRAQHVRAIYPVIKGELEETIGWSIDFVPVVALFKNGSSFRNMAGSDLVAAFAVPEKLLIVMDHSRVTRDPFKFDVIFKHELCHLLLHRYIDGRRLPRWLDEGVAQWVSDGMADIVMHERHSVLNRVVLSRGFIWLRDLERGFPREQEPMTLAYEESKSVVEYINGTYGVEGTLEILRHLKEGHTIEDAIEGGLSLTFDELETAWHGYLKQKITWFTYMSYHFYEILFALAAMLTVYGFVRLIRKKRAYRDDDGL